MSKKEPDHLWLVTKVGDEKPKSVVVEMTDQEVVSSSARTALTWNGIDSADRLTKLTAANYDKITIGRIVFPPCLKKVAPAKVLPNFSCC